MRNDIGSGSPSSSPRGQRPPNPAATSTRRTLVFPAVDPAALRATTTTTPPARPSERPTVPSLAREGIVGTELIELSASNLVESEDVAEAAPSVPAPLEDDSTKPLHPQDGAPESSRYARLSDELHEAMCRFAPMPRRLLALVAVRGVLAQAAAAAIAIVALMPTTAASPAGNACTPASSTAASMRSARVEASDHTPLASRLLPSSSPPPAGGCAAAGPPRMLSARAHLPAGIDVSTLEAGFGVAFASGPGEAVAVRTDGSLLRDADRVRLRTTTSPRHVVVEPARDDGAGELDVLVDGDDARSVPIEGPTGIATLRIVGDRLRVAAGGKERGTWLVPGAGPRGSKTSLHNVDIRAASRDGGGLVVALRRGPAMWIGLLDHELVPEGPLVSIARAGVTTGMPTVAAFGGGAALAWAERKLGEREWVVFAAAIGGPDDEARTVRLVGAGMSPSLAALPDGDLLLVQSEGTAGGHRVVARRLARDRELTPRGEPVVVSPDDVNAGQPAAAVAMDGRALVAFFAAGAGRAAVVARPLACDPGL